VENPRLLKVEESGERLDIFVARHLPELTRSAAQRLIDSGHITLNGEPAKAGFRLKEGDEVSVSVPPPPPSDIRAENIPLKIIYEDADLLVVDKPAGMTVHPAPGSPAHTLVNAVLSHLPELPDGGGPGRPGIVHRLDKDTSGLIVIAKTPQAHANLAAQFRSRVVKKTYVALVAGKLIPAVGVIDAPVGRDRSHRQRMAITSTGRSARTAYKVLDCLNGYTLVEAHPETGRTHQIRVHFASVGHPVVGDATYGSRSELVGRQFLHAHKLSFKLPSTGKRVEFTSPLPEDLKQALDRLKKKG
jgi:23S rRNA pseudouridine1911/1915/1917 synthase